MAKLLKTKTAAGASSSVKTSPSTPAVTVTPVPVAQIPTPVISNALTVVVLDKNSQPVSGANVSISPSNLSAVTDANGEAQFTLGGATKYEVTATAGGKTVTVPYYVTAGGATRLVVNPVYIQSIQTQQSHSSITSTIVPVFGIIIVLAIGAFIFLRFFKKK